MALTLDRRALMTGAIAAAGMAAFSVSAAAPRRFFNAIGKPIGIQLYALGPEAAKDLDGTFRRLASIGYREIELPNLMGKQAAEIRKMADASGLAISSIHTPTSGPHSIASDPQELADILGALGAKQVVVPMFGIPKGFQVKQGEDPAAAIAKAIRDSGADMWKELAHLLNERAALLKRHGIAVGYHNHNVEFMKVGSGTAWDILAAETDPSLVHFEVDIGWVTSAGLDPVAFFKKYRGRCRQAHVKDVKSGFTPNTSLKTSPTQVGEGCVDWVKVLPAAYAAGVRHFYVEQEPPFTMSRMEAAARSFDFLSQFRA